MAGSWEVEMSIEGDVADPENAEAIIACVNGTKRN
jgi:hypothetical protein